MRALAPTLIGALITDRLLPGETVRRRRASAGAPRKPRVDPDGPATVRQVARSGETAIMRASWRDPDDVKPGAARQPREITAFRAYCPLRRMAANRGSQITVRHIAAADELRTQFDLACLGATGAGSGLNDIMAGHTAPGPRSGPTRAALRQSRAARSVARVAAIFTAPQRLMLTEVVLRNSSMQQWCAAHPRPNGVVPGVHFETGRLVAILDVLQQHFADVIDARIRRGEQLA